MILEGKNISFSYPRSHYGPVLDKVSVQVNTGERVGLLAPSGRGKTTLCRLLAGYEKPQSGEILLDGKPIGEYKGFCPVQMIWQHPETVVDPLLTLGKTVNEGGPAEESLLEELHIEPAWLNRYPTELSGGELQRFCLARALKPGVKFLLCDEVTAMLDLITQAQIWEFLLKEAEKRQLGLLVVSHQEDLLEKVCTRIEKLA